jgi:hypothetical protein
MVEGKISTIGLFELVNYGFPKTPLGPFVRVADDPEGAATFR